MAGTTRCAIAALFVLAIIAEFISTTVGAQAPIDVYELADYRLTSEVFERFAQASGRVGTITREDPSFADAPLLTKDTALSGDAVAEVATLVARLENHAGLTAALAEAKITPREYGKFTIALIAARLAYGFVKAGVLQRVPSGAPTINVEFVKTHEAEVTETFAKLGIRD